MKPKEITIKISKNYMANIDNISTEENANQLENGMNLHSIHSTTPMGFTENQLTVEAHALKEKASQMFEFVYSQPGDYRAREIDTRTKEKPTKRDIENINIVVGEIINQHTITSGRSFYTSVHGLLIVHFIRLWPLFCC